MKRRVLLVAASALSAPAAATAQQSYPSRPISLVVAFPPGGQADVVARLAAPALERDLGVPVPVSNRPGASGEVGNSFVARAAPDGHTLLMGLSFMTLVPEAARVNGREPAYSPDQLQPIALFSLDPTVLIVPASSPIRTVEEFVEDVRRRPGAVAYSSAGNYSALHVSVVMLSQAAGLDMLHVPFQGGGPATAALLGGQVQCMAATPSAAAPLVRDGRARALAVWGRSRLPSFEGVPTFIERGFEGVEFYIWVGLFAPRGTPTSVVDRLRMAARSVTEAAEFQRAMAASGNTLDFRDGETFQRFYDEDTARGVRVVQRLGPIQ
ncbi:tripartite tricarboxylate transporter substrate binding protein [Sabulicella rubraurantiaca]|uniref:tripartite tricarboxylate transporter substrate binding protein n=1 Tax=Sabulicella rubraurantiaca TaxID=2811429 RepID=UPI001A978B35|nr:tripartite tricarboxylate transporter substrate binding protein [Sabulicella rubraurantiaca]